MSISADVNLVSIDLRWNPLTDSLSNLRNGNGRRVVHKLIPQIRILDGVQLLTNTSDAIDVETLQEAVDLIQQGTSQAHEAWSGEDAMVEDEMTASDAAGYRRQVKDKQNNSSMATMESSTGLASERRRSKAEVVGVERSPAISAVVVTNQEIVDWDSDLTQGGRQSFSGKPRSTRDLDPAVSVLRLKTHVEVLVNNSMDGENEVVGIIIFCISIYCLYIYKLVYMYLTSYVTCQIPFSPFYTRSSAIRRHRLARDIEGRHTRQSPTRILETLDMAKMMERGLKLR